MRFAYAQLSLSLDPNTWPKIYRAWLLWNHFPQKLLQQRRKIALTLSPENILDVARTLQCDSHTLNFRFLSIQTLGQKFIGLGFFGTIFRKNCCNNAERSLSLFRLKTFWTLLVLYNAIRIRSTFAFSRSKHLAKNL